MNPQLSLSSAAVKKEDVEISFADGMLTLSGERRQKEEQKDEKFYKVESFYGNFSRSFALPEGIDADAQLGLTDTASSTRRASPTPRTSAAP